MIPVQLKLNNFMSYGYDVPPLSFKSFHLACLTGNNGNGKSALLDAITWALWGQARGVDKNGAGMDDLVKLGQEFMEVEFTFELEGDTYRIIRKRDKKRGISLVEFQLQDGDQYRSISGNKIAETQKQIIQILKMDYETFTNSALVLQGKADTFTQQKPNDRKRILGEILGLGFYDELEKKARDKGREFEQEAKMLQQQIILLKQETKEKSTIKIQLEEIEKQENLIRERIKAKEVEHNLLLQQKQEYDNALAKIDQLEKRIRADNEEILKYEKIICSIRQKLEEGKSLLERETEIKEGFERFVNQSKHKDKLERKQTEFYEYTAKQEKLSNLLEERRKLLEIKVENLHVEIKELETLTKQRGSKQEIASKLKLDLAQLEELKQTKEANELKLKFLETEAAVLRAKVPDLKTKLEELKQNYLTLKKAPKCPLCSTDLETATSKNKVLELVTAEGKQIKSKIAELELKISERKVLCFESKKEIERLSQLILGQKLKEKELTIIERDLTIIEEAETKLVPKLMHLEKLKTELRERTYAEPEVSEITSITKALKDLCFDKSLYHKLILEVKKNKVYNEQMNKLTIVKDSLQQHYQNLEVYVDNTNRKSKNVEEDKELIDLLKKRVADLRGAPESIKSLSYQIEKEKQELSKVEQQKGALNERYKRCLNFEKEQELSELKWRAASQEKGYYSELTQAFGKKGIQAIIIENAIPELQDEANKLLNRMTDGRLNVALITQKGNKKGNVVETLDIQISDEVGTRKYEMYSGGEAFRVNFALRIALSKLLAKRAGARLQTLIIDEGFGTQDGKGKERLIELITAIQDDFAKIIVITHIQELKEAFPVHLEVKKDHEGSKVTFA